MLRSSCWGCCVLPAGDAGDDAGDAAFFLLGMLRSSLLGLLEMMLVHCLHGSACAWCCSQQACQQHSTTPCTPPRFCLASYLTLPFRPASLEGSLIPSLEVGGGLVRRALAGRMVAMLWWCATGGAVPRPGTGAITRSASPFPGPSHHPSLLQARTAPPVPPPRHHLPPLCAELQRPTGPGWLAASVQQHSNDRSPATYKRQPRPHALPCCSAAWRSPTGWGSLGPLSRSTRSFPSCWIG